MRAAFWAAAFWAAVSSATSEVFVLTSGAPSLTAIANCQWDTPDHSLSACILHVSSRNGT